MSAGPTTDTSYLRQPLTRLLRDIRPDAVVDGFHGWAADVIDDTGIPRITFTGTGCFSRCVRENLIRYSPHEKVNSDSEPFLVPGLPDPIKLTRSRLPSRVPGTVQRMKISEGTGFGTVINSFYDLESAYVDYLRNVLKKKIWLVGPVSLCNKKTEDKTERGKNSTIDEKSCLDFLNSKEPNSVLYISFGSTARLPPKQLKEIAYALEACDQVPFIWVIGKTFKSPEKEETEENDDVLPDGFEERMKESKKGLIIRGWAPQLVILEHVAIGGFMTHCGWNSTLEGVTSGVPMMTWPLSAEQFSNEKLVSEILRLGVEVGSEEWVSWDKERRVLVGREKVEIAVKKVMIMKKKEETEEMRRRSREMKEKARMAVEEGGSSYGDIDALIQEIKAIRKSKDNRD